MPRRRRRQQQGLKRVLGTPALFATAYENVINTMIKIANIVAILIIPLIVSIHGEEHGGTVGSPASLSGTA